jgi:hypothetical protein
MSCQLKMIDEKINVEGKCVRNDMPVVAKYSV